MSRTAAEVLADIEWKAQVKQQEADEAAEERATRMRPKDYLEKIAEQKMRKENMTKARVAKLEKKTTAAKIVTEQQEEEPTKKKVI